MKSIDLRNEPMQPSAGRPTDHQPMHPPDRPSDRLIDNLQITTAMEIFRLSGCAEDDEHYDGTWHVDAAASDVNGKPHYRNDIGASAACALICAVQRLVLRHGVAWQLGFHCYWNTSGRWMLNEAFRPDDFTDGIAACASPGRVCH